MTKFISFLIVINILLSCSKSENNLPDEKPATIYTVTNQKLIVSQISLNSSRINIEYLSIPTSNNLKIKIFYKKFEDSNWIISNVNILNGLERGKKYSVKASIDSNAGEIETPIVNFTTLGFNGLDLIGKLNIPNKKYSIFSSFGANFTSAPVMKAFLKIGNDSLIMKELNIISDYEVQFTLPDNVQPFFNSDTSFEYSKAFTIGLFSGQYYREISNSQQIEHNFYFPQTGNMFRSLSVFNQKPHVNNFHMSLGSGICQSDGKRSRSFDLSGLFWGNNSPSIYARKYNNMKITIQNKFLPNVKKVFNSNDYLNFGYNDRCGSDAFYLLFPIFNNITYGINEDRLLRIRLNTINYPAGNYTIKVEITGLDSVISESDLFEFVLD